MKKTKNIVLRSIMAAFGLSICGFGTYLTIRANVGVAPWDALNLGVAAHLPLSFGDVSVSLSVLILALDIIMKEKIGIGTILDAIVYGKSVDFFVWLNFVPEQENLWLGLALLVAGLFTIAFGQFVYMKMGLCCGPRDAFMVGAGRRMQKLPIGCVNMLILSIVLAIGWALGGPVGIGTVAAVFGLGLFLQLVCKIFRFEPRFVQHEGFADMLSGLSKQGRLKHNREKEKEPAR